jgi:hypothetical protein
MRVSRRLAAVAAAAVVGACALATTAMADTPAPGYEEFAGCPNEPTVVLCARTVIDGGHLLLGSTDTPIENAIELNGGVRQDGTFGFTAVGGLSTPRQRVPGGLLGLTGFDWLANLFSIDALEVYARAQAAGTIGSPVGPTVDLPLKIKLENPLLSSSCSIGSNADPVSLHLTSGTTNPPAPASPITGRDPDFSFDPGRPGVLVLTNGKLVDNAFAAPRARGCTMLLPGLGLIDPVVNLRSGLPSAAGTNVAEFTLHGAIASRTSVYPGS